MTREELEAALHQFEKRVAYDPSLGGYVALVSAARRQLALMPEKCGTCEGRGLQHSNPGSLCNHPCPTCHGSGKVYPPETVAVLRKVVDLWATDLNDYAKRLFVVELLDRLNETP